MECNKEEAIRAKEIAESKMLNKDFSAARKIARKAQRLCEDLENISQMLLVCDVHCTAEQKLFGSEMDWYGILNVESTNDDITIKKQYRKLALQLHPDKNKFPGAEAAFKLIGEAQRFLLDRQKRYAHDNKCKSYANKPAPHYRPPQAQSAAPNPTFGAQNNFNRNFTNMHFQHPAQSAAKPGFSNGHPTFWTACPFCNVRFQFHMEVLNKSIICQSCNKPFAAYERSMTGNPMLNIFTQPVFPQKKNVPNQTARKTEPGQKESAKVGESNTEYLQKKGSSSEFVSENVNHKKRKKQESDSSESCSSDSSSDESEADIITEKDGEFKAATNFGSSTERPRRSDRHKQNVSYKENVSDDEEEEPEIPLEKTKRSKSSFSAEEDVNGFKDDAYKKYKQPGVDSNLKPQNVKGKEKLEGTGSEKDPEFVSETFNGNIDPSSSFHRAADDVKIEGMASEVSDSACKADANGDSNIDEDFNSPDSSGEEIEIPEAEFFDFDSAKSCDKFVEGQIWALYSDEEVLPKYYGKIVKVDMDCDFEVRLRWLTALPLSKNMIHWQDKDMPVCCGRFVAQKGRPSTYTSANSFSHQVMSVTIVNGNEYTILPKYGEVWALYKNWSPKLKSADLKNHEYSIVEVLRVSDSSITVSFLEHVNGFNSVFKAQAGSTESYQFAELLRFSHQIPAFRLTGERNGSLRGFWELDPAALPVSNYS